MVLLEPDGRSEPKSLRQTECPKDAPSPGGPGLAASWPLALLRVLLSSGSLERLECPTLSSVVSTEGRGPLSLPLTVWSQAVPVCFNSSVSLGRVLSIPVPQFTHLENKANNGVYLKGWPELDLVCVRRSDCLACGRQCCVVIPPVRLVAPHYQSTSARR